MPPQNGQQGGAQVRAGGLMAKYGTKLDNAVKAHAGDETDYGMSRLPPGIDNGIAQLKVCTFGVYKNGKNTGHYFLRMAGVVLTPHSVVVNGVPIVVAGQQTQYMEALCDTVNSKGETVTTDEHVASILNEFRKLGADTTGATGANLETLAEMLAQAKPYFRFSTTMLPAMNATQQPRVFENWHGSKGLENFDPTVDPASPQMVNDGGSAEPDPMMAPQSQSEGTPQTDGGEVVTEAASEGDDELTALAKKADAGDKPSMVELKKRGIAAGIEEGDIDGANSWADVAEAITALQGEVAAQPEADAPWQPNVDEMYDYSYTNKLTKKTWKGNVRITAVDADKRTVDVAEAASGKAHKGVSWDALESAS